MTNWPGADFEVAPGPIKDPAHDSWPKQDEFDTAGPPPRGPAPSLKADPFAVPSGFDDQPLMFRDNDPPPQPHRSRSIPPRPAPPRRDTLPSSDPKTPPDSYAPVQPAHSGRPARSSSLPGDEFRTQMIGGGLEPGVPDHLLMLQFYDGAHWRELEQLKPLEHVVGRGSFRRGTPASEFLAAEHARISSEGDQLFVEEGETLNGVYRKVPAGKPVELAHGTRFQVGQHVIEFQLPGPQTPVEPVVSPHGETFRWRRLEPLAYLDFIGPDDRPSLRFPLTKPEGTVIGRESDVEHGKLVDIALTGDTWASRSHARVVRKGDRFTLEDLGSTNGTFVKITGRTPIRPTNLRSSTKGDTLLIGAVLIRVVEM